ncbi:MAG TPA: thermonuclease family protein [Gaiellaceae bacterium]
MSLRHRLVALGALLALLPLAAPSGSASVTRATTARVTWITDGDTIKVNGGVRVRLVQIDTPEVYFGTECYGPEASTVTKRLLPIGTTVRLLPEPATDSVDRYGRLLRYVVRIRDGVDVNVRLVALGAAAPYFYAGRRGRYADLLERLARTARAEKRGLWGKCPGTPYDPYHSVDTGRER